MVLDPRLLDIINKGHCVALVGAGPSCDMGYDSWDSLTKKVYMHLLGIGVVADKLTYEKYISDRKYPELYNQAERDLGDRAKLVAIVKSILFSTNMTSGYIYDILTDLPFKWYLTTNYDDELSHNLARKGFSFETLRNRKEHLSQIRHDICDVIFKLHSDLDHPDELILTSKDYNEYLTSGNKDYFRTIIGNIFTMFDVFIIGYSLSDPDLHYILSKAKTVSNYKHPIYMVASGYSKGEIHDLEEMYNIIVSPYYKPDGSHSQLRTILNTANRFIAPRSRQINYIPTEVPKEEVEAAYSLFLFRKLRLLHTEVDTMHLEYIGPLVQKALYGIHEPGVGFEDILKLPPVSFICSDSGAKSKAIADTLTELVKSRFVLSDDERYWLSDLGLENILNIRQKRELDENRALDQFTSSLKEDYSSLTEDQSRRAKNILKNTIANEFKERGLSIANTVIANRSIEASSLPDMFRVLAKAASSFNDFELRASFIRRAHAFIKEPTLPQKQYLAAISQGYFLYHMVGQDPICLNIRKNLFENTAWICDSSILIPLIAKGCQNHEYIIDLFSRLKELKSNNFATELLLQEAYEHLTWAINFVDRFTIDSLEFLRAALVKRWYKQNLFFDGFIRTAADTGITSFKDYLNIILPEGNSFEAFTQAISRWNIQILDTTILETEEIGKIEKIKEEIQTKREEKGTFRREFQVEVEAEVVYLILQLVSNKYDIIGQQSFEKVYFISPSSVLDKLSKIEDFITWTPEALYRYMTMIDLKESSEEMLHACILNDYFYAGVEIIDKQRYERYFKPVINEATINFNEQKDLYMKETEEINLRNIEKEFRAIPKLDKPFYVAQLYRSKLKRAVDEKEVVERELGAAKNELTKLRVEREEGWRKKKITKLEQELATRKNLEDQKHVRKRKRQKKKRDQKKKK